MILLGERSRYAIHLPLADRQSPTIPYAYTDFDLPVPTSLVTPG